MLIVERRAPFATDGAFAATVVLLAAHSFLASGCRPTAVGVEQRPVTLRIGFGLAAGASPEQGIRQTARNIALEGLARIALNGRTVPNLAEGWDVSQDGLTWLVRLRPDAKFHSGKRVDAREIQTFLQAQLPQDLGPAFKDIAAIRATPEGALEFSLHQRSTLLVERLDDLIQEPGSSLSGTGAFYVADQSGAQLELRANEGYYAGRPSIDRMIIKPYTTVRSAWADLLRGQVDVLYDVGVEALESLESSSEVKVFTFQRGYAYLLLLNTRKPYLADPDFRRGLNSAIDRAELVRDVLRGHGAPAEGALWPRHWAYSSDLPRLHYDPRSLTGRLQHRLKFIFNEPSYERLALVVQKQLQAVGVEVDLELVSDGKEIGRRLESGDFDGFLSDFPQGPNLVRPYLFWHSDGPFNYGKFRSKAVDAALDAIRHAADDSAYKAGVAAYQRAIVDDPPAIFLAWRERARAVSTRFLVSAEPGADILTTLQSWRPATEQSLVSRH